MCTQLATSLFCGGGDFLFGCGNDFANFFFRGFQDSDIFVCSLFLSVSLHLSQSRHPVGAIEFRYRRGDGWRLDLPLVLLREPRWMEAVRFWNIGGRILRPAHTAKITMTAKFKQREEDALHGRSCQPGARASEQGWHASDSSFLLHLLFPRRWLHVFFNQLSAEGVRLGRRRLCFLADKGLAQSGEPSAWIPVRRRVARELTTRQATAKEKSRHVLNSSATSALSATALSRLTPWGEAQCGRSRCESGQHPIAA